jgi:hypothetical protein
MPAMRWRMNTYRRTSGATTPTRRERSLSRLHHRGLSVRGDTSALRGTPSVLSGGENPMVDTRIDARSRRPCVCEWLCACGCTGVEPADTPCTAAPLFARSASTVTPAFDA